MNSNLVADGSNIADAVDSMSSTVSLEDLNLALEAPQTLGEELARQIRLNQSQASLLNDLAGDRIPYVHLRGCVRGLEDLSSTPVDFVPVPFSAATARLRRAALAILELVGGVPVAYRSENNGALFVNLVAMPGAGRIVEKSTKAMRGHTDAVSFPFPGESDPVDNRISPSPDFLILIGLRNPDNVSTNLIPLDSVLKDLDEEALLELTKMQYVIACQNTFREGTKRILGDIHLVSQGKVLKPLDGGEYWIRFSHSKVTLDPSNTAADVARTQLVGACSGNARAIVVGPGDILVINNHKTIHGRSKVGTEVGNQARWLLRGYGMKPTSIRPEQRYPDSNYQIYP